MWKKKELLNTTGNHAIEEAYYLGQGQHWRLLDEDRLDMIFQVSFQIETFNRTGCVREYVA
jgi:hypothetical protein